MDIRRIPLWVGRNATMLTNEEIRVLIEDQGDITLELSAKCAGGGWVNALSIPYFRGTGSDVTADPNFDWWKGKAHTYQAGGIYITFPDKDETHFTASNTYWTVRRYGTDEKYGGVWRLSEVKSRQEGNSYHLRKVDLLLPGHPVVYTALMITNTGAEKLEMNYEIHSMLSPPFLVPGCRIHTSTALFKAYPPNLREVAVNRLRSGIAFTDLEKAPSARSGYIDISTIPGATGSYDYVMGKLDENSSLGWMTVINPCLQMLYCTFFPGPSSPLVAQGVLPMPRMDLAMNYLGRMDNPWAFYEGGTPQVFSLTSGSGCIDHHGGFSDSATYSLPSGESRTMCCGNAFLCYDNPRIGGGFYTMEQTDEGLLCKRTKSTALIACDYGFNILSEVLTKIFDDNQV